MPDAIEQYVNPHRLGDYDHLYIANLRGHDYAMVVLQPVGAHFFVKVFNPGQPKPHDTGLDPDYQMAHVSLDRAKVDFMEQVGLITRSAPPLHPQPLQYADCYSLNLYCDHFTSADGWHTHGSQPAQYTGNSFADALAHAGEAA